MNTQKKNPGMKSSTRPKPSVGGSSMKTSPRPQKRPVDLGLTQEEKDRIGTQVDRLPNYYAKGGCVMAGRGGKYKGMK